MFLLRTIFWLVVLVLLLPTNAQQQSQVYGTAQAAVKDVSGFCERNPTVCATGKDAFDVFVHKARFGAEMLMSFVKGKTGFGGGDAETAADPNAADTAADPTATETPGNFDSAAPRRSLASSRASTRRALTLGAPRRSPSSRQASNPLPHRIR